MPEPTLSSLHLQITVSGDGVDGNSTVDFKLLLDNSATAASYHLASTRVGDNDDFQRDLNVFLNLPKSSVNNCTFYLEINAQGRDHFQGDLSLTFRFSDGSSCSFPYGSFGIGTYHESNSTRKQVVLVCP